MAASVTSRLLVALRRGARATRFELELLALSLVGLMTFAVTAFAFVFVIVGMTVGVISAVRLGRHLVEQYRRTAEQFTGVPIEVLYAPRIRDPGRGGPYETMRRRILPARQRAEMDRVRALTHDPATWRDLLWMLVNPLISAVLSVPAAAGLYGVAVLFGPGLMTVLNGETRQPPATTWGVIVDPVAALGGDGWAAVPAGLALLVLALLPAPALLRAQGHTTRWMLRPTRRARLEQRVRRLTEDRGQAVDAHAAELRRIERDLHDGAQARMVAVGIALRTMERSLDDPEALRPLIAQALQSSAAALADLRDLVRGIHPPVLAERGLADALHAVALDTPLDVAVRADPIGHVEPPIEAAVYFTVCELLANAVKHADARRVVLTLSRDGDRLRATVTDDGRGGADPTRGGGGLRGIRHRLAGFDGTLSIDSPAGGPTAVTVEVPCASS